MGSRVRSFNDRLGVPGTDRVPGIGDGAPDLLCLGLGSPAVTPNRASRHSLADRESGVPGTDRPREELRARLRGEVKGQLVGS